jgi:UDPglucose 6-dehydrogenase
MKNITVIGMGRLGAPFAACFAAKGFNVLGVDKDPIKVSDINHQRAPINEPGLQENLNNTPFKATQSIQEGVEHSDITFVIVSTPSSSSGRFSEENVINVCKEIGQALQSKDNYQVVVIASTISPLTIEKSLIPALEQSSGKECGKDFGLCYIPEWVALGELIHGFLNPDLTLIGEYDKKSGDIMEALYKEFLDNDPPIIRTNIVNAELSKVCLNAYVATKIAFANLIAETCERIPDADADVVTSTIGLDKRIGKKFFKGAVSYGGPCFPRDVRALKSLIEETNEFPILPIAVDEMNKRRIKTLANLVCALNERTPGVGILGLAFKPKTDVVEDSPSMWLIEELRERGITHIGYDPAMPSELKTAKRATAEDCVKACGIVVIMTACEEFKNLDPNIFENTAIVDCWGIFKDTDFPHMSTEYFCLGEYIDL